jgi:hypothetical protein
VKAIIRLARKMLDGVKFNRYMLRVWILFQIKMKGTISYRRVHIINRFFCSYGRLDSLE